MKINELKEILKSGYSQEKWVNTLKFLSGTKNLLTILLEPKHEEIKSAKAKEIVLEIVRLGTLKTTDDISLPVYDVTLQDGIKIEYNRVGVNDLLKTHILKDAIKGAIVTFHYRKEYDKSEWRFSFISKFGSDYFAEVESIETNPKKYTYIFGTPEEHRTALERLYKLEQSRFRLEDFFEAFNVEPVSNNFFKEYKNFYQDFVFEISNNKQSRAIFEKKGTSKDEIEKDIRNFVKRLLGRLVFLYFLQKKRWLGASNKNYDDGDTNFLFNLFNYNEESRVHFYNKWLSPLFFNALNTPTRPDDGFELADGSSVWIPFLNGGLFDVNQEPENHRSIQFPPTLFELLFKFFNSYNFTIYENSPEDHTVAVDPEMLGHIFENLLEDNKDKGAFYTPKEIVHYMTQESLIEYLNTHLSHSRDAIENLIKNHITTDFTREDLKQVEKRIDKVKICDPAIGSGAFPMGLLQEIFALKAVIHYELGYAVWSPAQIKQDIIQNSIYGVDLEGGAVDIARLRFWLSLVVDEDLPRPLPNLDYKIMQGNSLLESYAGIDLSNLATADKQIIEEQATLNFGDAFATKVTLFDAVSMEKFQELLDKYFSPEEWEKKTKEKVNKLSVKKQINNIIEGKIRAQLFKEKEVTENKIKAFESKFNIKKETDLEKLNAKSKELKNYQLLKMRFNEIETIEIELIAFQKTDERPYFLWNLYYADVFKNGGFDIVIGNPPYGVSLKGDYRDTVLRAFGKVPDFEIYYFFIEIANKLIKNDGVLSYIIPNTFLFNTFADSYRVKLIENWNLVEILDCTKFNIFQTATVRNTINLWKKGTNDFIGYRKTKDVESFVDLTSKRKLQLHVKDLLKLNQNWGLAFMLDSQTINIVQAIKKSGVELQNYCEVSQGYIPYRRSDLVKNFGNIEGNKIVDERLWHSEEKLTDEYLPEIFGRDLNKYGLVKNKNNSTKSFVKYGKHLAGYIDLKFFNQTRILVREITNPSIIATIISEVYVNDPQLISIINNSEQINYTYLWSVLNSKLATFYHFNYSPKATKGAFPKILVKDIKEFPIVIPESLRPFEILAEYLMFLNANTSKDNLNSKIKISYFEQIIDGIVYETYFPNLLRSYKRDVLQYLNDLMPISNFPTEQNTLAIIDEMFNKFDNKDHPIKNNLFFMRNIEEIAIIEGLK